MRHQNPFQFLDPEHQFFRKRYGFFRLLIGIYPHDLAPDQACFFVFRKYINKKRQAGPADFSGPDVSFDFVVKITGRKKFNYGFDHMKIRSGVLDMLEIIKPKITKVLGNRRIKIRQIMTVKYDALCVCFRIADPKGEEKFIIGFGHDSITPFDGDGFKHLFICFAIKVNHIWQLFIVPGSPGVSFFHWCINIMLESVSKNAYRTDIDCREEK
jgi:hypothetical protein